MRQLVKHRSLEFRRSKNATDIADLLENLTIDWCLHPGPVSVCELLLCDMDSTIIAQECVDELADLAG
ncbi:Phosphoserine phosphatase, partial [hydrothermal vent metagenome]